MYEGMLLYYFFAFPSISYQFSVDNTVTLFACIIVLYSENECNYIYMFIYIYICTCNSIVNIIILLEMKSNNMSKHPLFGLIRPSIWNSF